MCLPRRKDTAVAANDCFVATLAKDDYDKTCVNIRQIEQAEKIDFFLKLPLFKMWSRSQISKLLTSFEQKKVSLSYHSAVLRPRAVALPRRRVAALRFHCETGRI